MKKNLLRHLVFAFLIATIGLAVTANRAYTFTPSGPIIPVSPISPSFPLFPAVALMDHDDLMNCSVKSFTIDAGATALEMKINTDCADGTGKTVSMTGKTIDQFKIAYTQVLAAYLDNSKIQIGGVQKFTDSENYVATVITVGPKQSN